MRKTIKEDGSPLKSSEKNKRYREKKKQKRQTEKEFLISHLKDTEYSFILEWMEIIDEL